MRHNPRAVTRHDPRAALPTKTGYAEQQFGRYDAIDTPISKLTMGHAGLGNSPDTGLYLPVVSFLGTFLWRTVEISFAETGTWQQVWMRQPDGGRPPFPSCGGPGSSITRRTMRRADRGDQLQSRRPDGVPPAALLVQGGRTLPAAARKHLTDPLRTRQRSVGHHLGGPVRARRRLCEPTSGWAWRSRTLTIPSRTGAVVFGLKYRNGTPPLWAQHMRLVESQGNARVLRMDDVGDDGNYHGFHVITLYEDGERESQWFASPRGACAGISAQ